jgi:hypothetical protein
MLDIPLLTALSCHPFSGYLFERLEWIADLLRVLRKGAALPARNPPHYIITLLARLAVEAFPPPPIANILTADVASPTHL